MDTTIPLEVLLVEDNSGEIRLTQEAFHAIIPSLHFNEAVDGREAMSFLNREGVHADAPRPDLTLLDLNLPRMDGREVLARIKKDDSLNPPCRDPDDIGRGHGYRESYQLHANAYVCKPLQLSAFEALAKSICDFWLTAVKLPPVQ